MVYGSSRSEGSEEAFEVGSALTVERFEDGQKVDVTGTSKGKGFQGGVKRWNFTCRTRLTVTHSLTGPLARLVNARPLAEYFKGKKMAGHMGAEQVTTQNLEVVRVDAERNLLLIKGAVPGAPGGDIVVRPAR